MDAGKRVHKVLFIDDNKRVMETVKCLLSGGAYQFVSASNGFDGLFALVEEKPEIIFVGARVAKLNGYQFCILVNSKAEYQKIPVIIILDKEDCFEQAKALAAGAKAILAKPFGSSDFFGLIDHVFSARPQAV